MNHQSGKNHLMPACSGTAFVLSLLLLPLVAEASIEVTKPAFELNWLNGANGFVVSGIDVDDSLGNSTDGAGDVNGDGVDDVIIGAQSSDPEGREDAGAAYVVFGHSGEFDPVISAATLTGQNGFRIPGLQPGDGAGSSVAGAGDVNGDGLQDIAVGAASVTVDGISNAGEAYVIFGSSKGFPANFDLATLDGNNGFKFVGASINSQMGYAVSAAGDVNGDGIDDVLLGSPGAIGFLGAAYVVFGTRDGFPAVLDATQINGENGFAFHGYSQTNSVGHSVGRAGDINNDGVDDLIVGSLNRNWAFVVYGNAGGFPPLLAANALNGTNGFRLVGGANDDDFGEGEGVNMAGDVNGDDIDDLIIGSHASDIGTAILTGQAHVIFGRSGSSFGSVFNIDTLNGSNGFTIVGRERINFTGYSVSGTGDMNNDGVDDVLVSTHALDPDGWLLSGGAYLVYGSTEGFPAQLLLADLPPSRGYAIHGRSPGENAGLSSRSAGDINSDGRPDIILGAPNADVSPAALDSGEAYVIFGGTPPMPGIRLTADTDADAATANGFMTGAIASLQIDAYGLRRGEKQDLVVRGETGDFDVYAFDTEIGVVLFDVPPDALSLRVSITASDAPDADMFVGFDANGDSLISPDEERCNSGSSGSAEVCEVVRPESGSWWVAVMNWRADSPGAVHNHTVTALTLLPSGGDFTATGPTGPLPAGTPFNLDLTWDSGPSVPGDVFAGALLLGSEVGSNGDLGLIPVTLERIDTDSDADGVVDSDDNCITFENPDQRDTNNDGFGNSCDADVNNDCIINFVDLAFFKSAFFPNPYVADGDFDGDGIVNFKDLAVMKQLFFMPPGPSAVPNICDAD